MFEVNLCNEKVAGIDDFSCVNFSFPVEPVALSLHGTKPAQHQEGAEQGIYLE